MPLVGMPLPAEQRNIFKAMYGEIVIIHEIAVHFCLSIYLFYFVDIGLY